MTEAVERRERFLRVCVEAGATPDKALAQARAMEEFIINGIVAPLMLAPPPQEPAGSADKKATAALPPSAEAGSAKAKDAAPPAPPRKARHGKAWTPGKVAEFERMWQADAGISEIAAKFNLTKAAAYERARILGLGRRRPPGGRRAAAPVTTPATSDLPSAARPAGAGPVSIEGVIRFLQSCDMHIEKDPNSVKMPRWLVDGLRDEALTADELLIYANKERRRIGMSELIYGL